MLHYFQPGKFYYYQRYAQLGSEATYFIAKFEAKRKRKQVAQNIDDYYDWCTYEQVPCPYAVARDHYNEFCDAKTAYDLGGATPHCVLVPTASERWIKYTTPRWIHLLSRPANYMQEPNVTKPLVVHSPVHGTTIVFSSTTTLVYDVERGWILNKLPNWEVMEYSSANRYAITDWGTPC